MVVVGLGGSVVKVSALYALGLNPGRGNTLISLEDCYHLKCHLSRLAEVV